MPDTYASLASERSDREDMLAMHEALQAASTALRRDECGAWRITGTKGHIYAWGDRESFLLYVKVGRSKKKWTYNKRNLAFCTVTQDGDDEGCLRLNGLPDEDQAAWIRATLGIRRRPYLSPEHVQALRDQLERVRAG